MAVMAPPKSPAHEAQQLFFEIGMEARKLAAVVLAELGLTFPLAHALRLLEPDRPRPMRELADVLFTPGQPRTRKIFQRDAQGKVIGFLSRREERDLVFTKER